MRDVIIVGARCAGASLASFLGDLGYKVLLIDKYKSPKDPVLSTHILGGEEIYEYLDIREKIDSCGSPIIRRMKVDFEGHVFESDIIVTSRIIGVRRDVLDTLLLQRAEANENIEIKTSSTVVDLIFKENKAIGILYKDSQGNLHREYAEIVVGADGKDSLIADKVNAKTLIESDDLHSIYYSYVKGLKPTHLPTFEWFWHKQSVTLINPIDSSLHCIALIVPNSTNPKLVKENFINILSEIRTLKPRLKNIELTKPIKGLKMVRNFIKNTYGDGWVLLGDAANHLHPISGIGIDNAVGLAHILSIELDHYFNKKKSWTEAMEDYQLSRDKQVIPQYKNSLSTLDVTQHQLDDHTSFHTSMLCTFPSLIKKLCLNSEGVIKNLRGEER